MAVISFQNSINTHNLAENSDMKYVVMFAIIMSTLSYAQEETNNARSDFEELSSDIERDTPVLNITHSSVSTIVEDEKTIALYQGEQVFGKIRFSNRSKKRKPTYRTNSVGSIVFSIVAICGFSLILLGLIAVLTPFFALLPLLMKLGFSLFLIGIFGVGICSVF